MTILRAAESACVHKRHREKQNARFASSQAFSPEELDSIAGVLLSRHQLCLSPKTIQDLLDLGRVAPQRSLAEIAVSVAVCWNKRQDIKLKVQQTRSLNNAQQKDHRRVLTEVTTELQAGSPACQPLTTDYLLAPFRVMGRSCYAKVASSVAVCGLKRRELKRRLQFTAVDEAAIKQQSTEPSVLSTDPCLDTAMLEALVLVEVYDESLLEAVEIAIEEPVSRAEFFESRCDWYRDRLISRIAPPPAERAQQIRDIDRQMRRDLNRLRRRAGLADKTSLRLP